MKIRVLALTTLTLSAMALCASASAQVDPGHQDGGEEIITYYNDPGTRPPGGATPEPFTLALGAGAVGLYARRKLKKAR